MAKRDSWKRSVVGRRDTPQRIQRLRLARKSFFIQLDTLVPDAIRELRSVPFHAHEGKIVNTAEAPLPHVPGGRWVDLRDLILPASVARALHTLTVEQPDRDDHLPDGWSSADVELYLSEAHHLFVPTVVNDWADRQNLKSRVPWVAAFGTLVRDRWRRRPVQPLPDVVNTLHGFPILHPWNAVAALRNPIGMLQGYPTISPADPREESQAQFLARAKDHYRDASVYLDKFTVSIHESDLARDCGWLIRVQVKRETASGIAREAGVSRQAVDTAIRQLAKIIDIQLPARRQSTGRPVGRSESAPRRRIVNAVKQK